MPRPFILLTASTGKLPSDNYLNALSQTDYTLALRAPSCIDCFDALLLLGGVDPEPRLYGQSILHDSVTVDYARDQLEMAVIPMFIEAKKPIFGICRGLQILNVALGGTLWQDLPSQKGLRHSGGIRHELTNTPGLFTHTLFGNHCEVNSYHHQAIDRLAPGLKIASVSQDGTVEAVQHESLPVYAVQWHPELAPVMPQFFELIRDVFR
jgi:putative glutamine amidotransferase